MNPPSLRIGLVLLLAWSLAACSPVAQTGKGSETGAVTDLPPLDSDTTGVEMYLRMSSNEGLVNRSSELKFESGSCFLSNFYDFPDEIFGDSSLDNITTEALGVGSCRPLAIAQSILSEGGACPAATLALTAQDKAQISFDPTALATGLSAADFVNYAATVELSADCVCAVNVEAPLGAVAVKVPPGFALCTQKFPRYSAAALTRAQAQILLLYGIQ